MQIILLVLLIIGFFALRSFLKAEPAVAAKYTKNLLWGVLGVVMVLLTLTGRLNWLFALVGVAVASIARLIPLLLRYVPHLHRLWWQLKSTQQGHHEDYRSQQQHGAHPPPAKNTMSTDEAYQVLGLKKGAPEQDVIAAHRKLMQKIHPDRGGSDYLAAQINLAKKVLLNK